MLEVATRAAHGLRSYEGVVATDLLASAQSHVDDIGQEIEDITIASGVLERTPTRTIRHQQNYVWEDFTARGSYSPATIEALHRIEGHSTAGIADIDEALQMLGQIPGTHLASHARATRSSLEHLGLDAERQRNWLGHFPETGPEHGTYLSGTRMREGLRTSRSLVASVGITHGLDTKATVRVPLLGPTNTQLQPFQLRAYSPDRGWIDHRPLARLDAVVEPELSRLDELARRAAAKLEARVAGDAILELGATRRSQLLETLPAAT